MAASENTIRVDSASPNWVSLRVPCRLEHVDRVLQIMEPRGAMLDARAHEEMCTAVREMLMNAIEHGGKNDPDRFVTLECIVTRTAVLVRIEDPGEGFRPDGLKHAAVGNPPNGSMIEHLEIREAQGIRPGGFGMLMARNMVDELIYNEKGNEVLLVKRLSHE